MSFPTLSVIARISTPATAYRLQVKGSLVLAKMPSGGVYAADLAANTISASTSRLDDTRDDPTGRVNARVSSAGNLELVEGKVVRTLGPAEVIFGFSRDGDTVFVGVAPFPPEWRIRAYSAHTGVPRRTVVGAFTVRPANTEDAAFYSSFHSNTISWLNLTTGASRVVFQSPTDNPEASYEGLAVSHDDRWLIARTGSEFSGISVVAIDVTKGEQLKYMGPPCPWKQD